jgi:hypothetical protein
MKRAAFVAGIAALLAPVGASAADGDVRSLPASSVWALDFADERCSLIREFSDGEDTVRLQIDSYGLGPGYQVMISGGPVVGSASAPLVEFRVGYSPDTGERGWMRTIAGKFGSDDAVSFGPGFLPDAPYPQASGSAAADEFGREFQRDLAYMTVEFRRGEAFRLETGSMAEPLKVMRECVDDLVASWGLDPAQQRTLSRPPMLLDVPQGYVRIAVDVEDDRPGYTERRYQAILEGQAQRRTAPVPAGGFPVPLRVMIDATGQATACVVQVASASEAYRRSACKTYAGPYQPALDADGQPVASFIQVGLNSNLVELAAN